MAQGFPQIELKRGEIIVLQDILDVLQLKEGDIVEIHYDLFQAASSTLTKIKRILFDFENFLSRQQ